MGIIPTPVRLFALLACIVHQRRSDILCFAMLSIPHTLTGAFIASKIPHPAVYIPATLAFHYLQDWIPHWDVGTGLSTGRRKRSTAIMLEIAELIISIGLIWYFFQLGADDIRYHIWAGALTGIAPDLLEAPRNFLKWEPRLLKPVNNFHGFFHHSTLNMPLGLLPQVILIIAIWFLR